MIIARKWAPDDIPTEEQFQQILESCAEHRPWYQDGVWDAGPEVRKAEAMRYLQNGYEMGYVWDVWRDAQLCGIFMVNQVRLGNDALAHFLFFDHQLANKRHLTREMMAEVFEDDRLSLHALRVEIPVYARNLIGFARKALGFQYEAQRCLPDLDLAEQGSRRHEAAFHKGEWLDVLLLSITKQEFEYARTGNHPSPGQHSPDPGAISRD